MAKKKQKKESLHCRHCAEIVKGADHSYDDVSLNFCGMECARAEVAKLWQGIRHAWVEIAKLEKAVVVLAKKL